MLNFGIKNSVSVILQAEMSECGLACLAMIGAYHGQQRDLVSLRHRYETSLKGLSLRDLMHIADDMGFSTRPVRTDLDALSKLRLPCILHWDMRHFVVLQCVQGRRITIIDPSQGRKTMPLEEASLHFTGVALELAPTSQFEQVKDVKRVRISDLWQRITGLKRSLAQLLVLAGLLQIFALALPLYSQFLVDHAIADHNLDLLTILTIGFCLFVVAQAITELVRGFVVLHLSNSMAFHMRGNLFHHLLSLPVAYFEKRHVGDIVTRFGSLAPVERLLTTTLVTIVLDGLMALAILVVIFVYNWQLSLLVILLLLLNLAGMLGIFPISRALNEKQIKAQGVEQTTFLEIIRSLTTIKAFGRESDREAVWKNTFADVINRGIHLSQVGIFSNFGNTLLFGIGNIAILFLGARLVIHGELTLGMLFAFQSYQTQFLVRTQALISNLFEFKMLGLHLERLADIVHAHSEEGAQHQAKLQRKVLLQGGVGLDNVSYRYARNEQYIFENLDLKIEPGECLVIRGISGSGKSTLLKVLMGLLEPTSGTVRFDGQPVAAIGLKTMRRQIGVVLQNDTLLSGTLADNISLFDPDLDMDRIEQCAASARIDRDVSLMPMGYESLIGDMGSSLSGGQRQRVLLARALYCQPEILFLDEVTTNIDPDTTYEIMRNLDQATITRIMVTHDELPGIKADRELWLDQGRLVARTTNLTMKRNDNEAFQA